ncbi:3-isopropylmalate/(R)-2-methylmalate dehydratase large subunit [Variovorax boronicumulans]|nr:3-isopropylmalate dehydratase large subunit [Variovorax boronicumulans]MDP9994450.1 3-isopropylmalate/(R)-2-methylmalate dehydratase large subunit [Variovorax boronicumulans]MDQ0005851.1 3-isopropylmalate/(R)-2-methylmalate dehydratase large subunit [Variovorax boronicumulans]MDQ0044474.1 3-isopropylmalate/(R)-2-methylmalate dehydratase large subunit [Variovorax boronicumulans]
MAGRTLFDKIWDNHVVADLGDGFSLLHVDRHLVSDPGSKALAALRQRGHAVRNPELTFATPDHTVSTAPGRTGHTANALRYLKDLRHETHAQGIRLFDLGQPGQGIVHVVGPELGLTLPGASIVCSDSHTCTHGALGALAFGIGATEFQHVAATQTIVLQRPRQMRIWFDGTLPRGASAKDLILHTIGRLGATGASGCAVEYAGPAIDALDMEARMTVCNLSVEMGGRFGIIAPDARTFDYLRERPYAPTGALWERAVAQWGALHGDDDAVFDREVRIDASCIGPQITWGVGPQDVLDVGDVVPAPVGPTQQAALEYMGLRAGDPIAGTPIDWVFIGSCTNARISDLRLAAAVVRGRRVAAGVKAWVVPGSELVKRAAEDEGLDQVFRDAGFEWRESGCSLCVAGNGEAVPPGQRAVSTSNRNFVGRQGPGARTHLASPQMAAAAAVAGCIVDHRTLERHA